MKKSIFLFFAAILCAMNASAWSYKTAANNWTASTSGFKSVTMNSGKNFDVVMLKDVGDGVNICQNDNGSGHTLYCKWTKASGDIFRGTARWNNGLYCDETVVVPGGKVYIKVGSGEQVQMTAGADYTYTADVTFSTTGQSYTISGGTVSGATIKNESSMPSGGKPASLTMKNSYTSKNAGSVHVVFDLRTNKVTETAASEPEPVADVTVHFINSVEWAAVACHHWVEGGSGTSWPGDVLSKTDVIAGYDVYTATFTGEHTSCIFNNNNNGSQTGNLTVEDGKYYDLSTTAWYADKAAAEAALATPLPDETIYFVNNKKWTTINVYAWGGSKSDLNASWPGKPVMTKTAEKIGEYEVYSLTATQGSYKNLIFNNGSAQTEDYIWSNGKYYWVGKNKNFEGDTKENAEGELAAPVENVYTIAGAAALVGKEWDINATENKMQAGSVDGEYTLIKTDMTIAKGTYEYKVVCNHDWNDAGQFPAQGNQSVKIEEDGIYTLTFTYIVGTELKVELQKTSGADIETKYYVAGTLPGVEWNPTSFEMTANGSRYSAKFENVPAETYSFRITSGGWSPSWGYTHMDGSYSEISAGESDNNFSLKLTKTTTFTILFDSENEKITFEGLTEKTPVEDYYTIVGVTAITGVHWDPANEDNKMTKDGEVYTLTKTGLQLEAGDYEYKVAKNGAWNNGDYPNDGSNQKVTIAENGVYTIVYTYTVGTSLTAVPTKTGEYTPDKPVYTVAGDAALCGTNWKADDANNDMTDNGDGTFTWTKTGVKLTGDAGFKVVKNHDFGVAHPAENWVIKIADYDGAAIYTVTITFTESSKDIAVTLTKTGDVTPVVYTYYLMGVNDDWATGIKMVRNEANTDAEEYMLTCQPVNGEVKIKRLGDDESEYWYGGNSLKTDAGNLGTNTSTDGGDGNIALPAGIYNFYFNATDGKLWIAAATDCVLELGDGDNSNVLVNGVTVNLKVTRSFASGTLYTLVLPFAMDNSTVTNVFGANVELYDFTSLSENNGELILSFTKQATPEIVAGKPYLIKPATTNADGFDLTGVTINTATTPVKQTYGTTTITMQPVLSATAEAKTNGTSQYWLAADNNLYNNVVSIKGLRVIFDVQTTKANVRARAAFNENVETGVEDLFTTDTPVKAIVNGQLIIIRDGVKYNVQGQKL